MFINFFLLFILNDFPSFFREFKNNLKERKNNLLADIFGDPAEIMQKL